MSQGLHSRTALYQGNEPIRVCWCLILYFNWNSFFEYYVLNSLKGTGDAKMEQYLGSTLTELSYHWSFNKNRLAFLITSEKQKRGIWSPLVQNKVRTVHGGETKRHKMRKSTEMTHFCSVVTENETVAVSWLPGNTSRYLNVGVSSKERLSLRTKHHPFSGSSF